MKTTLDLPEEQVREMKVRAARQGRKLREVAAEIFQRGLALPENGGAEPVRHRVRLPLIPAPPGAPPMALTGADVDRLLGEQEIARTLETPGH